jgi:hypothetical protein
VQEGQHGLLRQLQAQRGLAHPGTVQGDQIEHAPVLARQLRQRAWRSARRERPARPPLTRELAHAPEQEAVAGGPGREVAGAREGPFDDRGRDLPVGADTACERERGTSHALIAHLGAGGGAECHAQDARAGPSGSREANV